LSSQGVACGDWDGDGREDVALSLTNDVLSVVRRDGSGFAVPGVADAPTSPIDVRAADWNRDGRVDLAVAQESAGTIQVLVASGGTYVRPSRRPWAPGRGRSSSPTWIDALRASAQLRLR